MLIKILDDEELEKWLPQIKSVTGNKSASKAVAKSASSFIGNLERIKELEEQLFEQKQQNYRLCESIRDFNLAHSNLMKYKDL